MEIAYKIIQDIADKISYIELCASIITADKGGIANPLTKETIEAIKRFINNSLEDELINNGPFILNLIEPIFEHSFRNFPPRKGLQEIAVEFESYAQKNPNYLKNGVLYGWLNDLIDCTNLYRPGLPSHARVGVNIHAGNFSIEESMIIRDAFFFMILGEREMEKLEEFVKDGSPMTKIIYKKAAVINANIGTYCRTSHLCFYSFIEAFINGIGLDHLYKFGDRLSADERQLLQGRKKGNHISLERKLEKYPELIRLDKKRVIVVTDKEQIIEPFKTFLDECKEIRDSTVHFSALKAPIIRQPYEWLEKIHLYSKITLEVAKTFWKACYEARGYPDYLDILDYDILRNLAIERANGEAL